MSDSLEEELKRLGITPDTGPGPYHRRIVSHRPLRGTRAGRFVLLECGHNVITFGDIAIANGVVYCDGCHRQDQNGKAN